MPDVLASFRGVKPSGDGWVAQCPGHDDRRASLSIGQGDDNRWLLKCHAGCDLDAILQAVHLERRDLFPSNGRNNGKQIVATYDYADEHGELVYQVVRLQPKDFRQRRGCSASVPMGQGSRCPRHAKQARRDRYARNSESLCDGRWRKESRVFLDEHRTCADCGAPSRVVDHTRPHKGDRRLFWAKENWAALCKSCHDKKTRTERGGGGSISMDLDVELACGSRARGREIVEGGLGGAQCGTDSSDGSSL